MRIEIKGVESLKSKLAALGADLPAAIEIAVQQSGKEVQAQAKLLCPTNKLVGSHAGELKNSITAAIENKGESVTSVIGSIKEYAPYVEFGTGQRGSASGGDKAPGITGYRADWSGMPAQPFLYPALKSRERSIIRNFTNRVLNAIKKNAGGK